MKKLNIMNDDEIIKFRLEENKNKSNVNNKKTQEKNSIIFIIVKCIFIIIIIIFISQLYLNFTNKIPKKDNNNNEDNIKDENININNENKLFDNNNEIQNDDLNKKIENCEDIDPINLFKKRIDNGPIEICKGKNTKHICYANFNNYYNEIFAHKNGVICLMENIILDPSKSEQSGLSYKGPVDSFHLGFPILNPGFFNTKCNPKSDFDNYNEIYKTYFGAWNYNYKSKENLEELCPGKTILFLSRNQDSPNLFHGNSDRIYFMVIPK